MDAGSAPRLSWVIQICFQTKLFVQVSSGTLGICATNDCIIAQLIIAQLIMRREDTRSQVKMAKKEKETKWIILKVYQNDLFIYSKQEYWAESYICSPWE